MSFNDIYKRFFKRCFDIFASAFFIIVFAPVIFVVYFLVRIKLGKPALFIQKRPGLKCKEIYVYKFRTMTNARDENGELLSDDLRLSPFGLWLRKLSLDELPQFFNVLKGDMSLVGPRPLLSEYVRLYSSHQVRRQIVRPGITGWAQVNGRNSLPWQEKLNMDVWYVDNVTFFLDIKILFLTLKKVFARDGINEHGKSTVSKFTGNP